MEGLSPRDREITEQRLFGNDGEPRTLEEAGREFGMTRERVRQIVKGTVLAPTQYVGSTHRRKRTGCAP
jgi:DNA-directed RNA polymerase sigma subunit (sigma70/sigma32)